MSSSDDKKLFLWEFNTPVVLRHIAEPDMHSVTYSESHPNGKYYIGS